MFAQWLENRVDAVARPGTGRIVAIEEPARADMGWVAGVAVASARVWRRSRCGMATITITEDLDERAAAEPRRRYLQVRADPLRRRRAGSGYQLLLIPVRSWMSAARQRGPAEPAPAATSIIGVRRREARFPAAPSVRRDCVLPPP
jgi:hypothetical protein